MVRRQSALEQLEVRKRLLVAESELLRARATEDLQVVRAGIASVHDHVKTVGTVTSIAAVLIAGGSALRHLTKGRAPQNVVNGVGSRLPSMLSRVISGARIASGVWRAIRSRRG